MGFIAPVLGAFASIAGSLLGGAPSPPSPQAPPPPPALPPVEETLEPEGITDEEILRQRVIRRKRDREETSLQDKDSEETVAQKTLLGE